MPIFICLNLLISYAVDAHNQLEQLFLSPTCEYLGILGAVVGILCFAFSKLSLAWRYEIFCCGAVLIWISTWPPFFNADSPVIFFFPLFFCFISVLTHFLFYSASGKHRSTLIKIYAYFGTAIFLARCCATEWHYDQLIFCRTLSAFSLDTCTDLNQICVAQHFTSSCGRFGQGNRLIPYNALSLRMYTNI